MQKYTEAVFEAIVIVYWGLAAFTSHPEHHKSKKARGKVEILSIYQILVIVNLSFTHLL